MGDRLFPRAWRITVDVFNDGKNTLDVSGLDVEFKILRSIKAVPNKASVVVWNLNDSHRALLQARNRPVGSGAGKVAKPVGIGVTVEAGYVNATTVLFSGDLREASSARSGTDWKTTLAGDDGGRAMRESTINRQFTKGTPVGTVLREVAAALGLGLGNVANYAPTASILGLGQTLPHTLTLAGNAKQALDRLVSSMQATDPVTGNVGGVTYSIQRGVLQMLPKGRPLQQAAVLLSPATGLLDSPAPAIDSSVTLGSTSQFAPGGKTPTTKKKPKPGTVIKAKAMLIPGLVPGRIVKLESANFDDNYMVAEVEYVGQSWGRDWYANLVLRVYK